MRNALLACSAAVALAVGSLAASAAYAVTFAYSFSSNDGTQGASGLLDATLISPGEYVATSGSILAFGPLITGSGTLIANPSAPAAGFSPSGFFTYDDLLLPGMNPLVTHPGLLFDIGGLEVNIFSNGPGPMTYSFYVNDGGNLSGNFALTQLTFDVPEPASWALMLGGFGLIGTAMRRRGTTTVRFA